MINSSSYFLILAYWNEQNGRKNNSKKAHIGLFAGDSCSRPKEAISQSLRFLDAVGFHDPSECLINNKEALKKKNETSKLIGKQFCYSFVIFSFSCPITKGQPICHFCSTSP